MIPDPIYEEMPDAAMRVYETGERWTSVIGVIGSMKAVKITIERIEPIDEEVARSTLDSVPSNPVDPAAL